MELTEQERKNLDALSKFLSEIATPIANELMEEDQW